MPEEKRSILLASVKKLIELGIPDNEIVANLADVGIRRELAQDLLMEAHGAKPAKQTRDDKSSKSEPAKKPAQKIEYEEGIDLGEELPDETPEDEAPEPKEKEEVFSEVYKNVGEEPEDDLEKEIVTQRLKPAAKTKSDYESEKIDTEHDSKDLEELWRTGILATVDSKLAEMEQIRNELDKVLDEKISKLVDVEMKKLKVVFDSQKTLLLNKIDMELEEKGKEISSVIDVRMDELKNLSNVTIANMKKIDLEEVENKRMLQEIDSRFKDLDRTKATLIASMDKTISETKAKLDNSLEDMQKKVSDMDSRVNRSLQLESKVTEGLLKDAQAKIDKLQLSKEEELSREINKRLSELDAIRMKVKPEEVEKRISQMDHIKATIDDEIKAKLDELTNYNRKQMQTVTDELNIFKEQFIATIGKNVDAFNRAKSEFAEMVKAKDEAVQQKLSLVDAKMKELDEFEKSFADEMGVIIEKAPERKPEKQDLKKKPAKK